MSANSKGRDFVRVNGERKATKPSRTSRTLKGLSLDGLSLQIVLIPSLFPLLPAIQQLTKSSERKARLAAVDALNAIGTKEAMRLLLQMAGEKIDRIVKVISNAF